MTNASFDKTKLDYRRVKIDKEKSLEVTITIENDDAYTIIMPEGYWLVDPDTGVYKKELSVDGSNFYLHNENDFLVQNDGDKLVLVTVHGAYLLKADEGYVLTDEGSKIAIVQ